ncbi:sugar kinase [Salinimonas lutimaris]|uniref:sugar kinase n=1 Tax=Salinimonas lutimaris TaxID=914153 RepID=UPI0010C11297|nr:sugar kinase [Salinimonas lutimaris]
MRAIYFLGECMVELRGSHNSTFEQSFAGDVYNSAVYLKRAFMSLNTGLITAVGHDTLSDKMLQQFASEELDTHLVFRHDEKVPGMYLIELDDKGERSFVYWRSDAAARQIMQFLNAASLATIKPGDSLFFSGISLAVIDESDRRQFWRVVKQLQQAGVKIIFDPNYRARLWRSPAYAAEQYNQAFAVADIALPGVEDLSELYGIDTAENAIAFCKTFEISEVVVKNGPESVLTWSDNQMQTHTICPVSHVVDTTSAGDAFNGVYLGARMNNKSVAEAVQLGARAAGTVIQHPGAIIPLQIFSQAMKFNE